MRFGAIPVELEPRDSLPEQIIETGDVILDHLVNVCCLHIARDNQRRIVRHVITPLNQTHHRRGGGRNRLTITERLLSARVF